MIALPFTLGYFISSLANRRHRYLHYTVPVLAVVGYLLYPSAFYFHDDGVTDNIFWLIMGTILLTFSMRYVRNRIAYRTMLAANVFLLLPALLVTCMVIAGIISSFTY